MRIFGLTGYPLSHSFSQQYFTAKFSDQKITDAAYSLFPLGSIDLFPALIQHNPDLAGLNVTIPYKRQVMKFLDFVDDTALKIGAVNTIKITRESNKPLLYGYNTDAFGFAGSLKPLLRPHHKKAIILGTGGAANAASYVLEQLGVAYVFVSRKPVTHHHISYDEIDCHLLKEYKLLINATPAGMFPATGSCPALPYSCITKDHLLFDMVYNPVETLFLAQGKKQGAVTMNGMSMLYLQAEKSWEIWNS